MKLRALEFHPAALEEARNTAAWYAREGSLVTARAFEEELRRVTDLALRFGAIGQVVAREFDESGRVRRFPLRRFPYIVFYLATEERIYVLSVAHARRKPGFWLGRLSPPGN